MNKNKLLLVLAVVVVVVAALSLRERFEDGKQLYGPAFTGMASSTGTGHLVSPNVKDIVYPVLFGPQPKMMAEKPVSPPAAPEVARPRPVPPKKEKAPKIAVPSSASLGSDEKSKFLPTSRVPGDMDLIPDPYRVNSSFSTSTYTSKTEPVPFLTDFSAFMK
jgi:hypothetical protein